MGHRFGAAVARALALAAAVSCTDARPARIAVAADPFLFNGSAQVQLPAQVLTADGRVLTAPPLEASSGDTSVVRVGGGTMQCLQDGDAQVSLRAGPLRAAFTVRCRPVVSFAPFGGLELAVGGSAQDLPVYAFGPSGARVETLRYAITEADTAVIAVDSGRVRPKRRGATTVRADFGGITTAVAVTVVERLHDDRVTLVRDEIRAWPLGAGRYRIRALGSDRVAPASEVELVSDRANCARLVREPGTLHCVVEAEGRAVVRALRAFEGYIVVDRMPD